MDGFEVGGFLERALLIDARDLATRAIEQVVGSGHEKRVGDDHERAGRLLSRYLGPDLKEWDHERLRVDEPARGAGPVRLRPARLVARDLSHRPAAPRTCAAHRSSPPPRPVSRSAPCVPR